MVWVPGVVRTLVVPRGTGPGPYLAVFGCISTVRALFGHCLAVFPLFGPYLATIWPYLAVFPTIWPYLAVFPTVWLYFPLLGHCRGHCRATVVLGGGAGESSVVVPGESSVVPRLGLVLGGSRGLGILVHCVCGFVRCQKRQFISK